MTMDLDMKKTYCMNRNVLNESFKADCLNDGEHELEKVEGHHYHPDWVRCKTCEYENKGELDREQLDRDTIQWDKQV